MFNNCGMSDSNLKQWSLSVTKPNYGALNLPTLMDVINIPSYSPTFICIRIIEFWSYLNYQTALLNSYRVNYIKSNRIQIKIRSPLEMQIEFAFPFSEVARQIGMASCLPLASGRSDILFIHLSYQILAYSKGWGWILYRLLS